MNAQIGHHPGAVDLAHKALVQQDLQFAAHRLARQTCDPRQFNGAHRRQRQHGPARVANIAEIDAGEQEPGGNVDPIGPLQPFKIFKYECSSLSRKSRVGRGRRNNHKSVVWRQ